jgi:hypothetical protein
MFRHTFATRQLHAGVPIAVVSKLLGHGSISTTLNIYAHVLAEHLEQFERQRARFLALIWHLTRLELQKSGKSRSINDAGWSSLVARRAHNPPSEIGSANLVKAKWASA